MSAEKKGQTCILSWLPDAVGTVGKGSDPFFHLGEHVTARHVTFGPWLLSGLLLAVFAIPVWANRSEDDLGRRASWAVPSPQRVSELVDGWLKDAQVDAELADEIRTSVVGVDDASRQLDVLAEAFDQVSGDARQLVTFCRQPKSAYQLPEFAILADEQQPAFVRHNQRLLYGRWLVNYQLYDEALAQLGDLQPADVIDPAALLFYQSVAYHRLLKKDECLPTVDRLMENEDSIPRRYLAVARLIQADIEPLKKDSLDEVSRLMDSIQVRLGHARAGTRVRQEEDDVIAKLDKMIEKLEQLAGQASSSSSSTPGGALNPSQPMQDSMPGGGSGPGNIDAKKIGSQSGWGDLPPKEREQALQELGKDFPSHYRDVIEEYFRKLARDGAER